MRFVAVVLNSVCSFLLLFPLDPSLVTQAAKEVIHCCARYSTDMEGCRQGGVLFNDLHVLLTLRWFVWSLPACRAGGSGPASQAMAEPLFGQHHK